MVASFVSVTAVLHPPDAVESEPASWELDVGFIDDWRPLYAYILGNVGFLDRFTVTISRFAQATAVEPLETFDSRCGTSLASPDG